MELLAAETAAATAMARKRLEQGAGVMLQEVDAFILGGGVLAVESHQVVDGTQAGFAVELPGHQLKRGIGIA